MKMIETGKHILTGAIYYIRIISAILVVIITVSFALSCLAVGIMYAVYNAREFLLTTYPIVVDIIKYVLSTLTISALVWILIIQPLYEKGKEIELTNKLKKTGTI